MFKKILILSIALFLICITRIVLPSDKESITLYWTDLGIEQWNSTMKLGDDFSNLNTYQRETIIMPESKGQILIPMPSDDQLPKSDKEWQELSSRIYQTIKTKVNDALTSGIKKLEIRTIQNINKPGYADPWRQGKVVKFIQAFSSALESFKSELSSNYEVTINGVWGSNGGYAASRVVPTLKYNLVDKGILVDARAWESDVKKLYHAMNGNLAIINTAGDAPASEGMVANHETAKTLKIELPTLKVYWVDSKKGINFFIGDHLRSMHWDTSLFVKEFLGDRYIKIGRMSGSELRDQILSGNKKFSSQINNVPSYFVSPDSAHPSKSLTEAETLTETVHEKHKALIAGKGSEADLMYKKMVKKLGEGNVKRLDFYKDEKTLQLEARKFGADVILGVKESKREGGVYIDPKPSKTGKGGTETKKEVLESRPSEDSLYWDVK